MLWIMSNTTRKKNKADPLTTHGLPTGYPNSTPSLACHFLSLVSRLCHSTGGPPVARRQRRHSFLLLSTVLHHGQRCIVRLLGRGVSVERLLVLENTGSVEGD